MNELICGSSMRMLSGAGAGTPTSTTFSTINRFQKHCSTTSTGSVRQRNRSCKRGNQRTLPRAPKKYWKWIRQRNDWPYFPKSTIV